MKVKGEQFREYVKSLRRSEGLRLIDIASKMGLKMSNFSNKLNANNVQVDFVKDFGKIYDRDVERFFIYDKNEITSNNVISDLFPVYEIDTIKNRVNEIESQFDSIIKGQETLKAMMLSGIDFIDIQTGNMTMLKKLVGIQT